MKFALNNSQAVAVAFLQAVNAFKIKFEIKLFKLLDRIKTIKKYFLPILPYEYVKEKMLRPIFKFNLASM